MSGAAESISPAWPGAGQEVCDLAEPNPGARSVIDNRPSPYVLEVEDLSVRIETRRLLVEPVTKVSLQLKPGETLGIVGESGSGKSMTGLAIMGMLPPGGSITSGSVKLGEQELVGLDETSYRRIRGNDIAMVFQDSQTALNPTRTIGAQIAEAVKIHRSASRREARERAIEVLAMVGIPRPRERLSDFPHELSGGMRQRVMIAMALACEPKVIIADEPTTALDVTIQAQVLALLDNLRERLGMAMVLITHDMGVIAGRADRVQVMYAGRTAEAASTTDLFTEMRHHYTRDLLASIPHLDQDPRQRLYSIRGLPPDPGDQQRGCPYASRCQAATSVCVESEPSLTSPTAGHQFACWHPVSVGEPRLVPTTTALRQAAAADAPVPARLVLTDVAKEYPLRAGLFGSKVTLKAVSGVSLEIAAGETYGLVGESGCGKSTLGRVIVGLERIDAGSVALDGRTIAPRARTVRGAERQAVQMMFQDPYASLDPRMRVETILREPLRIAGRHDKRSQKQRVAELLEQVGLSASTLEKLPHQLSGGQRQRVGLARPWQSSRRCWSQTNQ